MQRIWPMYRAMVGVGLVCGLAIVGVFVLTGPRIAHNRAEALQRAIFEVLPEAQTSRTFVLDASDTFAPAGAADDPSRQVHAAFDDSGSLVGVAIPAAGMGYQDTIRLLYGYAPGREAIVGIRVLESKETPGLGDKIEKDPGFLANFTALDVTLSEDQSTLRNPVVAVKQGDKQQPWEVDGITGATISSVAVADMLRVSASFWVPQVRRQLDRLVPEEVP